MTTLIIEHLRASELPPQWALRIKAQPGQTVTVRIETEALPSIPAEAADFVTDDPAFGIWRDRAEVEDVEAFVRRLRAPRYRRDGLRDEDAA